LALQPIEAEQLWKSAKGNDIWAFAVVECISAPSEQDIPTSTQAIIHQYADIFQQPKTLPPSRVYDHAIPLQPDAVPVNSRPYKYSP
jgi:hypothetical protein